METYKQPIDLLSQARTKKQRYILIVAGLIYITGGIFYIIEGYKGNSLIFILTGLGMMLSSFLQRKNTEKLFIELNGNGIKNKQSYFSSSEIKWDDIKAFHFSPVNIEVSLKSGGKEKISLANLSYNSVISFKKKLEEFAAAKGISID